MTTLKLTFAFAALLLGACQNQAEKEAANVAAAANATAALPQPELPPALKAERTYRCKDTSLVYADFFVGDMMVNVRTEKTGTPTVLKAPAAGEPFVAEGYSLTGSGDTVTFASPSKPAQSCSA